jgi:hypothetical protein
LVSPSAGHLWLSALYQPPKHLFQVVPIRCDPFAAREGQVGVVSLRPRLHECASGRGANPSQRGDDVLGPLSSEDGYQISHCCLLLRLGSDTNGSSPFVEQIIEEAVVPLERVQKLWSGEWSSEDSLQRLSCGPEENAFTRPKIVEEAYLGGLGDKQETDSFGTEFPSERVEGRDRASRGVDHQPSEFYNSLGPLASQPPSSVYLETAVKGG